MGNNAICRNDYYVQWPGNSMNFNRNGEYSETGDSNVFHDGYDDLPDFDSAMENDLSLKMMVEEFYTLDESTLTLALLNEKFEAILFKWSGIENAVFDDFVKVKRI